MSRKYHKIRNVYIYMHENTCTCEKVHDQDMDCWRCGTIKQFIELHPEAPTFLKPEDEKHIQHPIVRSLDYKWEDK